MKYLHAIILILAISSCKKASFEEIPHIANKNILIILEANNNLKKEAFKTINDIEKAYDETIEGVIFVYLRSESDESVLIKIKADHDLNTISSDTVEIFKNSFSSAQLIGEVAYKVQKITPALSYGIILWSHATSWFPTVDRLPKTKSFGNDNGLEIDIIDLAAAIPKNYEFIMFDACNMASLEVIFEFKDNCKYFLASPTEIISTGFPYHDIITDLMHNRLENVAQKYYQYYYNYTGLMQSATVSLVLTKELDLLAELFAKSIISNNNVNLFKRENVQRMDFSDNFPVKTFDFASYLKENFQVNTYLLLLDQIEKTVKFKRNTPYFYGKKLDVFSGLTCYIPEKNDVLNSYYSKLKWVTKSQIYTFL